MIIWSYLQVVQMYNMSVFLKRTHTRATGIFISSSNIHCLNCPKLEVTVFVRSYRTCLLQRKSLPTYCFPHSISNGYHSPVLYVYLCLYKKICMEMYFYRNMPVYTYILTAQRTAFLRIRLCAQNSPKPCAQNINTNIYLYNMQWCG